MGRSDTQNDTNVFNFKHIYNRLVALALRKMTFFGSSGVETTVHN